MPTAIQTFELNTKIFFGPGALAKLAELGSGFGRRVLLVAGRNSLQNNGMLARTEQLLKTSGCEVITFAEVEPEPSLTTVTAGLKLAREKQVAWVIGIGGGSALDAAKAIAGLFNCTKEVNHYFNGAELEAAGIPLIAVPTTAGSGAEVTVNAVLTDTDRRLKQSIRDPRLAARVALVDPELTVSMPLEVTVNTGLDALIQGIEAFTSKCASPLSDVYSYAAIEKVGANLWKVYQNSQDIQARSEMALGSLFAGIALTNARLGAVHGLAHSLGLRSGKPHGLVCAVLLVSVMRFNMAVSYEKYALMARALGINTTGMDPIDAAASGIKIIMNLQKRLGIPNHISGLGVTEADFAAIIAESLPSGSLQANPREAKADDLLRILQGNV